MSFKKGSFYLCTRGSIGYLTAGKVYECHDHIPASAGAISAGGTGTFITLGDDGHNGHYDDTRFDPVPMSGRWNFSNNQPPRRSDVCACGKQAVKKEFLTFSYLYCESCKVEVGGKAAEAAKPKPPVDNTSQQLALPPGIVALKGEKVVCSQCFTEYGELMEDCLVGWVPSVTWTPMTSQCCPKPAYMVSTGSVYVKGRGWV